MRPPTFRRTALAAACTLLLTAPAAAQQPAQPLTLQDAIALAQQQGLAAQSARSALDAARWRDRAFSARLLPQLSLDGTAVDLDRGINPITLPTGETRFVRQSQNQSSIGLTMSQEIPWTGGRLSVGSQLSRIDLFGDQSTQLWQTTPLVVSLQQDVFRPRTIVWQRREQGFTSEIAERQYLEAREELASTTADAYFDVYAAQLALDNAAANATVNDTLYTLNTGRYEVGRIGENDLLQSELALLRARASLDGARLELERAQAALRRLLGLDAAVPIVLAPVGEAPTVTVDPEQAVLQARRNASAMQETELQLLQSRRRVNEARLGNRVGATVTAMFGLNQTAAGFGAAYESPLEKQRLVLSVDMPLFQWGGGQAEVQAARAEETRTARTVEARREALEEEARFAARQLDQAQRMLTISAKADTVAAKRFEVARNRYTIGRVGIGELYIAQSEKDGALQQYVQALRGYWASYYRLRRLTLYDFAENRPVSGVAP